MILIAVIIIIFCSPRVLLAEEGFQGGATSQNDSSVHNASSLINDSLVLREGDHASRREYFAEFWSERFLRASFNAIETNNIEFLKEVLYQDIGKKDYARHEGLSETNSHVMLVSRELKGVVIEKMISSSKADLIELVANYFYGNLDKAKHWNRSEQLAQLGTKVVYGDEALKINEPKGFEKSNEKEWKIHISIGEGGLSGGEAVMTVREYDLRGVHVLLPAKYEITAVH